VAADGPKRIAVSFRRLGYPRARISSVKTLFLSAKYAHGCYRCSTQLRLSRRHRASCDPTEAFYSEALEGFGDSRLALCENQWANKSAELSIWCFSISLLVENRSAKRDRSLSRKGESGSSRDDAFGIHNIYLFHYRSYAAAYSSKPL